MTLRQRVMRAAVKVALAPPAVQVLARHRRDGVDRALDPQVAAILELQRMVRLPSLESMEPAEARRFAAEGFSPFDVATVPMAEVIDTHVANIPVRIFVPHGAGDDWIVYFHGGGGVIGSVDASEPVTRLVAAQTRCTVASVEYRLGPEHKHPAAIEDAIAAWDGLMPRVRGHAAVAGDSFGGFLSAHVAHGTRGRKPDLQVLTYPLVDLTLAARSIAQFAEGYLLTRSMIHWFRDHYLHPDDDQRAGSPAYFGDLRGSSPAIVVTAGYDPLVDEGDAYAAALAAAGVPVVHRRHDSLIHGFLSLAGSVGAAREALDQQCRDIVDSLHPRTR